MLNKETIEKFFKLVIWSGLIILVLVIYSQSINFTNIDLGRHLENGRVVWQNSQVLFHNFYSYTEPNFDFINHHWLSGVILYAMYLLGGFKLLTFFNIAVALATFLVAFNLARKKAGFYLSAVMALPSIFLLSERVEIRPEILSYLLIMIVWALINRTSLDYKWRRLSWLIPIFILWANLHIYFFIGLALLGIKAASEFILFFVHNSEAFKQRFWQAWHKSKPWIITLFTSLVVCLLNPNTYRGLLYPFNIFNNYGYEIAENKTVNYLSHLMINPNFLLFKALLLLLIISWLIYYSFSKKQRLFDLIVSVFFSLLALFASRNLAIFALAVLVIIPINLSPFVAYLKSKFFNKEFADYYFKLLLIFIIIASIFYLIIDGQYKNYFIKNKLGFDLLPGSSDSSNFFKDNNLEGPIFNNYDLGSALIFWLFPQESVFVDNRPEAYSPEFFNDIYRPLQADANKWEELSKDYKFKTIYFSHTDGTPWAQQFLARILSDSDWALVYFDRYTVILLNKELNDKTIINRLQISPDVFRKRLRSLIVDSTLSSQLALASLAGKNNQPYLAEEIYRNALIKYSDSGAVLASLGYFYSDSINQDSLLKSLIYFEAALEKGYKLPAIYNSIGLVNWQLERYQLAEMAWKETLKLERKNISALYYLNQIEDFRRAGKIPFSWSVK